METAPKSSFEITLRSLRLRRGLTQEKLAAEIGYSPSYYAMVERESRLLRPAMAERIALVLGVGDELLLAIAPHLNATGAWKVKS